MGNVLKFKDTDSISILAKKHQEDEAIIAKGLQYFFEVGFALIRIRDSKSYKEVDGYNTFQEYCKDKWNMGRSRIYQLIDASILVENLSTIVDILPETESQCRPLIQLNPEDQRTVWKMIIDSGRKITAKLVYETVEEFQAADHEGKEKNFDGILETDLEEEEVSDGDETDNQENKALTAEEKEKLIEIFYVGYSVLSKKYDPNAGGSTKDIVALNNAKNFILSEFSHILQ